MGGTTSDSISNCQPSDTFSHCQSSNTNTWNNNPATSYNEAIVCYNTEQPSTTLPEQWEDMNNRSSSLEMLSRPPSYTTATSPRITLPRPTLQMNDHGVQYIIIPVPGNQSTNSDPLVLLHFVNGRKMIMHA
ncbi:hypothetical protein BDF22DRAFT_773629 [Syncephalis plumigaleata]|nr:hypothetical protein BDF22DRAFT_773629 [Syncephalis plumigaleata]